MRVEGHRVIGSGIRALQGYLGDPFRQVRPDAALLAEVMARPGPDKTYAIMFTPRSGSTWLADLLGATPGLGHPTELFNPLRMRPVAQACGAGSLAEYLDAVPRARVDQGVFGFKITYPQMRMTFGPETAFADAFRDARFFWLIREDIVAQAVSGSRMVQTGVSRVLGSGSNAQGSDRKFRYQALDLRLRVGRLRAMEQRTERFFARFGIEPVRLSYERMLRVSERDTARSFARALGVTLEIAADPVSRRSKVGTGKSTAFAARFKVANARYLAGLEKDRAELLGRLEGT